MKVEEFVAERRRATAPVDPSIGGHTGGLIPTQFINFEEDEANQPSFIEAPENLPQPTAKRAPNKRVVPQQVPEGQEQPPPGVNPPPTDEAGETEQQFSTDCCEDDEDADRMLLRLRVLNTFGKPLTDCFVALHQEGGQAAGWTGTNGMVQALIRRPIRTEKGEQASKEIAENSEGKLKAPAPPAPAASRTPCVDVCVSRRGACLCTTRLYFQDVPENADDAFWNGTRVIQEAGADFASFDIVVDTGVPHD